MNSAQLLFTNGKMLSLQSKGHIFKLDAGDGNIVAHDLLEHPESQTQFYFQEIMAAGGILFVRGSRKYFSGNRQGNVANLTEDILILACDFRMERVPSRFFDPKLPVSRKAKKLMEVVTSKIITINQHIIDGDQFVTSNKKAAIPYLMQHLDAYRLSHERMITEGYKIAKKRFGSQEVAAKTFINIEREVDFFLSNASYEMEGEKFTLNYDAEDAQILT